MEFNHALYVAGEVEKLLLSEAAIKYGELAFEYFINKDKAANIRQDRIELQTLIDSGVELIDLLPDGFPVSMLRQRVDDILLWTVSVTRSAVALATTSNSSAGRSRSRNHATLSAVIRSFIQEQTALQKAAEKAAAAQVEPV